MLHYCAFYHLISTLIICCVLKRKYGYYCKSLGGVNEYIAPVPLMLTENLF